MGKKKSVVLMTLLTIVMLILCAVVAFPSFTIPGTNGIKKWNPVALQYDLGAEFSGGHYAYYYPKGVITETEYEDNLAAIEDEDERTEYAESYKQYGTTGLYLSTAEDDCIFTDGNYDEVSADFKEAFEKAVDLVNARFAARAQKTGSSFRVAVVDDYAIRVQLSASEVTDDNGSGSYAYSAFAQYANMEKLTFEMDDELVEQMDDETDINSIIKKVSVKTKYKIAYIKITFTSTGKKMLKAFKASDASTLTLKMGDTTLMSIDKENHINSKNEVEYGVAEEDDKLAAETLAVLIKSAMSSGGIYIGDKLETPFQFESVGSSQIFTYDPVYGNTLNWIYVAILVVILLASVLTIVKMGGFGVMNLYTTVIYLLITAICFAFITGGVFVVSLGSIFTFFAGLAIVNVLNVYIYNAIKAEAKLGKTVQSSVKSGYKKTLWNIVDIYAVLLLGAIALLIGVAGLQTIANQAIICILSGAFCNLLGGRVINCMLLSASKDKYKYFHFVREDDEDDE